MNIEYNRSAIWNNITIPENSGTKELTGTFTKATNPQYEVIIDTSKHEETILNANGESVPLYSERKKHDGQYYHLINQQNLARYLLNNISSEGRFMDVEDVSSAFDEILKKISKSMDETYWSEIGSNIVNIPETNTITSQVTVTIDGVSTPYTLAQLTSGVNGLKYTQGTGFEWTISEELAKKKLSLKYEVAE